MAERLNGVTVRFTEKTVTTYDGEKQQRFSAAYKLDTSKRPWRIQMTTVEVPKSVQAKASTQPDTTEGLVVIDQETRRVKLIYALPGGQAPKDFKAGKSQNMFELERLKAVSQTDEVKKP